jgi:hypothetical protein
MRRLSRIPIDNYNARSVYDLRHTSFTVPLNEILDPVLQFADKSQPIRWSALLLMRPATTSVARAGEPGKANCMRSFEVANLTSGAARYSVAVVGILQAVAEGLASAQRYDALVGSGIDVAEFGLGRANLARIAVLGRSV